MTTLFSAIMNQPKLLPFVDDFTSRENCCSLQLCTVINNSTRHERPTKVVNCPVSQMPVVESLQSISVLYFLFKVDLTFCSGPMD